MPGKRKEWAPDHPFNGGTIIIGMRRPDFLKREPSNQPDVKEGGKKEEEELKAEE